MAQLSAQRERLLAVGPLPSRILIVTDAWHPQVNGVVRTLATVTRELTAMGHDVQVIGPDRFRTLPMPTYPDIRVALFPGPRIGAMIERSRPDALHIATEGSLGHAARRWAMRRGCAFTTAYHTRFPDYIRARVPVPEGWIYAWLRWFHGAGQGLMVATPSLADDLAARGFDRLRPWTRGVDTVLFRPEPREPFEGLARPISLYVGRIAVEKNIRAFLSLDLPGSKAVVGAGPQLAELKRDFPNVTFLGPRSGPALAECYAGANVMVFPSLTDTFGLVLLESLACGTPVAAYPVAGPRDVLAAATEPVGALNDDLRSAVLAALQANRDACRRYAERFSWRHCAEIFLRNLVPLGGH